MIDAGPGAPLPRRLVRHTRTTHGIELYFPPLRLPEVALPLLAFGALAFTLPALGAAALLPSALADAAGAIVTVLVIVFLAPFALFGAVLALQAIYMQVNALRVRVSGEGIDTVRYVLCMPLARRHHARSQIAAIESRIPARHQSLFSSEPVYQLVACDAARARRVVVAESLRGEAMMSAVKAMIEDALGVNDQNGVAS